MASSVFHILGISRQDMLARLTNLDVIANNLANVSTVGFKASRANFQELLEENHMGGAHLTSTQTLTDQGSLKPTDNALDLAISGDGFFAVTLKDGRTAYTRDGQLTHDPSGRLVTSSGYPLVWQGQIPADAEEVQVTGNGTVLARRGTVWSTAGSISLTRFVNPTALQEAGDNVWLETAASGAPQTGAPGSANLGTLSSHAVEQSNVALTEEMTNLVTLQRAFQISTKTFQQTDTMISEAIHMRKA